MTNSGHKQQSKQQRVAAFLHKYAHAVVVGGICLCCALGIALLLPSCENFNGPKTGDNGQTTGDCDTLNVSYSQTVKRILETNCTSCHAGTFANAGVDLTSVANITRQINRNRIFPRVLTASGGALQMPPGSRLSQCEINQVTAWVNQGAKNN